MPQGLIIAVALSATLATTAGCGVLSGSSGSSGAASSHPAAASGAAATDGAATDGASGSAGRATASDASPSADVVDGAAAGGGAVGLNGCLVGGWHTDAAREFEQLGMTARSKGAITGASGVLRMRFAADHGFTFSYDDVKLTLTAGQATVNGPITGTWALAGRTLTATVKKSSVRMAVVVGGMSINPSGSFDSLLRSVTPQGATTACSDHQLSMTVRTDPAKNVTGTVTFDRG